MRSAAVSLVCLMAACATEGAEAVFIEDFGERSPVLACAPAELAPPPASVVRLKVASDTLLAVIADGDREILLLDHDLAVRTRVRWEEEGPAALREPVDLEVVGDTLLVVADRGRGRLVYMDLEGTLSALGALGLRAPSPPPGRRRLVRERGPFRAHAGGDSLPARRRGGAGNGDRPGPRGGVPAQGVSQLHRSGSGAGGPG